MNRLIFGNGAVDQLSEVLDDFDSPILLVTGGRSYFDSGAASVVQSALTGRSAEHSVVEGRLPTVYEATRLVSGYRGLAHGTLVAVGGGLVQDSAKLMSLHLTNPDVDLITAGTGDLASGVPIVAVPTTAGSGSERTPFAVAYEGMVKHSVSHPSILPKLAIVDPRLTDSMSPALTAASGLDVLAHAIEASWAVGATPESLEFSLRALDLVWRHIGKAVESPDGGVREAMAMASTTAGAAIATAKTTASHALSYHLTAEYGVPHGAAAAITLGAVLRYNAGVNEADAAPGVSAEDTKKRVDEIAQRLGAKDAEGAAAELSSLIDRIGMPTQLGQIGIRLDDQMQRMAQSVNAERLSNNPRMMQPSQIIELIQEIV